MSGNGNTGRKGGQFGNTNAVRHGGYVRLDLRSKDAKALKAIREELIADIGGDPTAAERILIDRAAHKKLRCQRFEEAFLTGQGEAAHEHYLALANSLRLDLTALGLKRRQKAQVKPWELKGVS